jgi:signal transduction histidine kinase
MFVRTNTHEIRTPLTTVFIGSQLLEKKLELQGVNNRETRAIIGDMKASLEIALGLVNDMLTNDKLEERTMTLEMSQIFIWEFLTKCIGPFNLQVCCCLRRCANVHKLLGNMGLLFLFSGKTEANRTFSCECQYSRS